LLVQSDTAVIPLFEQYAAPLLLALGTPGEILARQLKVFDFDGALLTFVSCCSRWLSARLERPGACWRQPASGANS
jgi:hypothetical protein